MEDQSKRTVKELLTALLLSNRRHARYVRVLAVLAVAVAVVVPLAIRQHGITMTTQQTVLDCQYAGNGAHTHNADCYDADGNLVCPLPERPFHTHTASCYATERVLVCGQQESAGHAHTDACYDEEGNLTCTTPETPGHTHTDACYETRTTDQLICGMEETADEHVHSSSCFKTITVEEPDPEPAATNDGDSEGDASDPKANSDGKKTTEEPNPEQEFSGVLKAKDENGNEHVVLVVAVKAPKGALPKGSTMRVSAVNTNDKELNDKLDEALRKEAGDDAAFTEMTGVDITFYDAKGNRVDPAKKVEVRITNATIRTFSDQRTAGDEAVENNSIVVLHVVDKQHTKRSNAPDAELVRKVALVNQDEDDHSTGHEDTVRFEATEFSPYVVARVDNAALAEEPDGEPTDDGEEQGLQSAADSGTVVVTTDDNDPATPAQSFSHRISGADGTPLLQVNVYAPEGAFPLGTTMRVSWVDPSQVEGAVAQAVAERTDGRLVDLRAVDITFLDADGAEIEPAEKITVTFASDLIDTEDDSYVVHVADDGSAEVVDALGPSELQSREIADEADELVIESDAFSTYVVAVTTLHKEMAASDGATYDITVDAPAEAGIPQDAELVVAEVAPGTAGYQDYLFQTLQALGGDPGQARPELARFFDIKIVSGGEEVQPQAPVRVSVQLAGATEGATASAVHFARSSEEAPEVLDVTQDGASASFDATGFSVYGIVYTVDFHWEANGKYYEFSLPGGGFASLSKLVEVLGIEVDTVDSQDESTASNNGWLSWLFPSKDEGSNVEETGDKEVVAASNSLYEQAMKLNEVEISENTREFIANIEKVEFSNPSLVWVGKTSETTTIGEIKSANELVCEYSAELTEDQISEINSSAVEAADWVLIGVQPFASEETLTITMKNGDQFVIRVTDAQLKKTVISASGEMIEVVVTYDDSAEIPVGATLEITEFAEDSDEYQAAREAVVEKKQSENPAFDDEEFGVTAFDVSIVDEDGNQVEPKATVDVSMKMNSLPEEAAEENVQYSFEIHHFDESSGEVAVENVASAIDGSIQIEEETAQAEFQLESFSTFTISWSENANQTSTTARWTYNNGNQSRVFINVYYVDENGNAIQRPANLGGVDGWQQANYGNTVDHWLGNDPVNQEIELNIQSVLAKDIPGRTFSHAYINPNGTQIEVTKVAGSRMTDWNYYNSVTYKNDEPVPEGQPDYVYQQINSGNQLQGTSLYLVYSGGPHTTIHYGYMEDGVFKEFDEQPSPTNTSSSFGWAHLIYDFATTDDKGLPVDWKYSGTYYHTSQTANPVQSSAAIQPLLRYSTINRKSAWRYYNGAVNTYGPLRNDNYWHEVADGSEIYVVYEKPVIPTGGSPTLKPNAQSPDVPNILKESVENEDGTNTLSLSVTGSTAPMDAEKVADVIVVLDLSSSMRRDITDRDTIYSRYWEEQNSRFYQAKAAIQRLADNLYAQNSENGEEFRLGLVTFSNKGVIKQTPTADSDVFQGALDGITRYSESGTNWEHALQIANQMSVQSDRATYIVFITDGEPTERQTRGNLTNEQLSGVNNTGSPATEGDIFHGGRSGGQFFDNSWSQDTNTPDFRDYLGTATFGGIEAHPVWIERNKNASYDEVRSILGHNKGFFAIGVSTDIASIDSYCEQAGVDSDHYALVTNESKFVETIDAILDELQGFTGQADVRVYDGITDLTQTISKVNQEEHRLIGADGDFVYYKSKLPENLTWDQVKATWTSEQVDWFNLGVADAGQTGKPTDYATWSDAKKATYELGKQSAGQNQKSPADLWGSIWRTWNKSLKDAYNAGVEYIGNDNTPGEYENWSDAQKAAYAIGKGVTFIEWTTREADGCAEAVYDTGDGAVKWNMGETFMLEDGVTYKVSFICWPSQEAYDIIAKLENGTITFGDTELYPQEVWDQFENTADGYRLKTNEEGANTKYRSATSVSGNVTPGDEQPQLYFQHVPPMPLVEDKIDVAKTWEASRIDSVTPEDVILQVVGGNEIYKQFEIEPTQTVGDSATNNYGRSGDIYISCGHLKVNTTTGKVIVFESGHDFSLREVGDNSRHWDLEASVCRPMKISKDDSMRVTMLVLVDSADVPADMTSDMNYYASSSGEYYRIDGHVYKVDEALAEITGMNTRRSFLDLAKEVLVEENEETVVWPEEVDEKFTYKIKINVDPTTLSWDPDLEKYVIISVADANGNTVNPASILVVDNPAQQPQAKLPSECGFAESYNTRYLVAEDNIEFYLSIKNGWNVRFLNLPVGTTYSIEEVLPDNSNYDFNNVRLETRKNKDSADPDTTQTYNNSMTLTGSIAETSTLYKVVYQNDAKAKTIQILKKSQDGSKLLGGAKFDLYTASAYNASPQGSPFKTDLVSSSVEATKGQIDLGSLPAGRYYLKETEAPDGYNLKTEPVVINVGADGVTYNDGTSQSMDQSGIIQNDGVYQLTVTNDAGAVLPEAGGPGTFLYTLCGVAMFAAAGFVGLASRRKARKEVA